MHIASSTLQQLPWHSPEELFTLCQGEAYSVFLDSGGPEEQERHRWSFLCPRPTAHLTLSLDKIKEFPQRLREFSNTHRPHHETTSLPADIPFTGGIIGLISYEAGMACEGLTSRHTTDTPAFTALACRDIFIIDRKHKQLWWSSPDGTPPPTKLEALPPPHKTAPLHTPLHCVADCNAESWMEAVRKVRAYIEAGDIFQANLTMRWSAPRPPELDLGGLYKRLRTHCPAPFGAWFHTPNFSLLSASVERFLSLNTHKIIETRPIKGTCGISKDPQTNTALRNALAQDEKECAENLMITDLMRHDIGRVCALGSVDVPQLFAVERFAHVHHLVSSVTGHLRPECDAADLLAATLPPGSVTGAPKYRALEIIDEIETSARGAYCGTLFRLGWDGSLDSSVIIRSISATPTALEIGAGGGITWPSDPKREYDEMCLKAAALLNVIEHYNQA